MTTEIITTSDALEWAVDELTRRMEADGTLPSNTLGRVGKMLYLLHWHVRELRADAAVFASKPQAPDAQ